MANQSRFIGRAGELAALLDALGAARAGNAAFGRVGGAPGIGETRLFEEFARLARADGWAVVSARMSTADGAPAFRPWRQLLQRPLGQHVRAAVAAHGPQVARIVPELDSVPAPPPVDPEERFRAFAGFGRLLADAAGPGRKA